MRPIHGAGRRWSYPWWVQGAPRSRGQRKRRVRTLKARTGVSLPTATLSAASNHAEGPSHAAVVSTEMTLGPQRLDSSRRIGVIPTIGQRRPRHERFNVISMDTRVRTLIAAQER